jgi:peptide/nickel transport system permease protein
METTLPSSTNMPQKQRLPRFWAALFSSPAGMAGALIMILMVLAALFAQQLAPFSPDQISLKSRLKPPSFEPVKAGEAPHVFGTDSMGRDLFSRVIYGARISLMLGLTASFLGLAFGVTLGMLAGYYGGRTDSFISWLINVQMAFPFTLLAIFIIAVFGGGLDKLIVVLAWATWVNYARIMRGQVIAVKNGDYVHAAFTMGASPLRVMFMHILPNSVSPLIVVATFTFASVILQEAALSFLGLGVDIRIPTWGSILSDGRAYLQDAWWIATLPGIALLITALGANLFGDWLRDYLDPRLRVQ